MTDTIRLRPGSLRGPRGLRDRRDLLTFGAIGVVSTAAYVVLYLSLRSLLTASGANAIALLVTVFGNTEANRRLTFRVGGRHRLLRDHAVGLVAFGVALAITTAALGILHAVSPTAPRTVELAVLLASQLLATVVRFVLLRAWLGDRIPTTPNGQETP